MDSSFSVTSRRSYDIPKPETGLAEWTSKIKALQREVDADEEAEQKRLEEEIAAARQARLRRKSGLGAGTRVDSLDMSSDKEQLSLSNNSSDTPGILTPKSMAERENDQESALRKLMGRNEVYNPDKIVPSTHTAAEKSDSVSLAAFIGGRATGPRLNRHAPQQDAHDPTQFIQPNLGSPHPIFGRGGVAMPGMAAKKEAKPSPPIVGSESFERYRPSSSLVAKPTSSLASSYLEKVDPNKWENSDTQRHGYTATPKPISTIVVPKQNDNTETSTNRNSSPGTKNDIPQSRYSPKPISTSKSFSYLPKSEDLGNVAREPISPPVKAADTFQTNRKTFNPKPVFSSVSPPYLAKREETTARDPSALPTTYSNQSAFTSSPKPTPSLTSPSELSKKDNMNIRDPSSLASKSVDTFRSNQHAFSSSPKLTPSSNSPSYLPKKEDTSIRDSGLLPSKPAHGFRSTYTASKPLSSYIGATRATDISGKGTDPLLSAETPLRQLMDRNNVHNPDKIEANPSRKSVAERAQSVSLAAFMGGSAAGPRLNRHAPQQDAHDPTQFVQPDISVPHPIFGRGGVAMPGMAARKNTNISDDLGSEDSERYRPSSSRPIWPPVANNLSEKVEERPVSPQKTGNRERTTSAPSTQPPHVSASQSSGGWFSSNKVAGRQSPDKERLIGSARDRTSSGPSYPKSSSFSSSSPQSSVTAPSLARNFQSIPKPSSLSPQIPITTSSPAFQKPPPQKDLTPSISRLQGRGFVQNMVKASAQFEAPPSSPTPDKSRPTSAGGRKGSVLDRWQPSARSISPTKSIFPSNPNVMKRSSTQEPTRSPIDKQHSSYPFLGDGAHIIKSTTSMPSLAEAASSTTSKPLNAEPYQRSRTPGLGSATTMVLIKPSKSSSDLTQLPHVDELGVKNQSRQRPQKDAGQPNPTEFPQSSEKPLIHPTKDRARKPRKHNDVHSFPGIELSSPADSLQANPAQDCPLILSDQQTQTSSKPMTLTLHNDSIQLAEMIGSTSSSRAKNGTTHTTSNSPPPPVNPTVITQIIDQDIDSIERTPSPISEDMSPMEFSRSKTTERLVKPSPVPLSPTKHIRIPSTGNRPTVMEVAQTLIDHPKSEVCSDDSPNTGQRTSFVEPSPRPRSNLSQIQAEKRKSSYERYSAIILPSLKEEATPTSSPAGTLTRAKSQHDAPSVNQEEGHIFESKRLNQIEMYPPNNLTSDPTPPSEESEPSFPDVDLNKLYKSTQYLPSKLSSETQTISVEVLVVTGTTATPLSKNVDIFYDSEVLVIIHRTKSRSSGLASTSVWCWLGRCSTLGDREERKMHELARRYGTNAKIIHQLAEPSELIQVLGGRLAIRQGTRMHWSSENTTMHLIRSLHDVIRIDEHDLNIKNLCSAFSYCVTILGSVYVWHGRGSTPQERKAALRYTDSFSADTIAPIVLMEGEDDNDEIFWMILGDEDYARADYWQWRKASPITDPSIWRLDAGNVNSPISAVKFISMEQDLHKSIYAVDCLWEFFVVVGKEARGNKRAIRFALDVVKKMSSEASSSRPYVPTVHVLILPSRIPLDLGLGIRDIDEAWLNDGEIPDHMNLLNYSEAVNHLLTHPWGQVALKDPNILPLGVGGST